MSIRSVLKLVTARSLTEGVGVAVNRGLAIHAMHNFNPFILIDHFKGAPGAGFPFHPHAGMETITYMVKGHMMHEDFTGARGVLGPGDVQVMTAGAGIAHQEVPIGRRQSDTVEGIQLWVALPQALKNSAPGHRIVKSSDMVSVKSEDRFVNVISGAAGEAQAYNGLAKADIELYHYIVAPGAHFQIPARRDWNWFMYVMSGNGLEVGPEKVPASTSVFFKRDGDLIEGRNSASSKLEFFLAGGEVLDQDIFTLLLFSGSSVDEVKRDMNAFKRRQGAFARFATYVPQPTKALEDALAPWKGHEDTWVEKTPVNDIEFSARE